MKAVSVINPISVINAATVTEQQLQTAELIEINAELNNILNSSNLDAFARLRVSNPQTIFDSKQIYDGQPLFWDNQEISGGGTTTTYNTNQASTTLAVSNLTAGHRVRQTFRRFNYQPGKSQLIIRTGILGSSNIGNTKRIGLHDAQNGLYFGQSATGLHVGVRSFTSGFAVDTNVLQTNWNIDKLDGTGDSGITLDPTKTQIFFFDFEWLGVGTIRYGVFIDGKPIYCHAIHNANSLAVVYMSTPNLPLRTEIINDGTGPADNITDICSTVITEGGREDTGVIRGLNRTTNTLTTLNDASIYPLIGVRLSSTHLGAYIGLIDYSLVCVSAAEYAWFITLNPTEVGTAPVWNSLTNSAVEYTYPTNATTLTGGTILATGLGSDTASARQVIQALAKSDLTLGSTIAGVADRLYLCVQRLTGTTETFYSCLTISETV